MFDAGVVCCCCFCCRCFYNFAGTCTENFHSTTMKTEMLMMTILLIILIKSHWLTFFRFSSDSHRNLSKTQLFLFWFWIWLVFLFFCFVLFCFDLFRCRLKRTKTRGGKQGINFDFQISTKNSLNFARDRSNGFVFGTAGCHMQFRLIQFCFCRSFLIIIWLLFSSFVYFCRLFNLLLVLSRSFLLG